MILLKERGWKEGVVVWIGSLTLAFLVGGILAQAITYIPLIFS
jgi:ferrous iron transport protein B